MATQVELEVLRGLERMAEREHAHQAKFPMWTQADWKWAYENKFDVTHAQALRTSLNNLS